MIARASVPQENSTWDSHHTASGIGKRAVFDVLDVMLTKRKMKLTQLEHVQLPND
jgi:hypothetical protein